jgi:MFS family permease
MRIREIRLRKEGMSMAKKDKLKEELAESRHGEIIALMLGTFAIGALSVAIAVGWWQGWWASFPIMALIIIGLWGLRFLANRNTRRRKEKIEQLDNQEESQMPAKSTKQPTLKEIMDEIKESRKATSRAVAISMAIFGATIAIAGLTLFMQQFEPQVYAAELIGIGVAIAVFYLFLFRKIT